MLAKFVKLFGLLAVVGIVLAVSAVWFLNSTMEEQNTVVDSHGRKITLDLPGSISQPVEWMNSGWRASDTEVGKAVLDSATPAYPACTADDLKQSMDSVDCSIVMVDQCVPFIRFIRFVGRGGESEVATTWAGVAENVRARWGQRYLKHVCNGREVQAAQIVTPAENREGATSESDNGGPPPMNEPVKGAGNGEVAPMANATSKVPEQEKVELMLNQWAEAHRSNDPEAVSFFYGPSIGRYFLKSNVDQAFVVAENERIIKKSDPAHKLTTFELQDVTIEIAGSTAQVGLVKHSVFLLDPADSSPNRFKERFTRCHLGLSLIDGAWRIVSERDFLDAGS
jgi:hypothetical protein